MRSRSVSLRSGPSQYARPGSGRYRATAGHGGVFTIARDPQEDGKLPYLLRLPIEGGLVLKARDTWPRGSRVYCHPFEEDWPPHAEVVEETPSQRVAGGEP